MDLIERQAVLKLLSTIPPEEAMTKAMLIQSVKQMDSETVTECNNLISRQSAIDAAVEAADEWDGGYSRSREEIITLKLRMLPSAQPKRGRWRTHGECIYCSECRHSRWSRTPFEDLVKHFNYCPNCGAKMENE